MPPSAVHLFLLLVPLAYFVECSFEASCQLLRRSSTPVMQKDYERSGIRHVVVDRHNLQSMRTKRLECWSNFGFKHRDIASNSSIIIGSDKRRPGIEAHACIDPGSHFFYVEIIAAHSDFVHGTVLLTGMTNDFRDPIGVKHALLRRRASVVTAGFGGLRLSYQFEGWLDLICQIESFAMPMDVHKKDA